MEILMVNIGGDVEIVDSEDILSGIKKVPGNNDDMISRFLKFCNEFLKALRHQDYEMSISITFGTAVTFWNGEVIIYRYVPVRDVATILSEMNYDKLLSFVDKIAESSGFSVCSDNLWVMMEALSISRSGIRKIPFREFRFNGNPYGINSFFDDSIDLCLEKLFGRFLCVKFNKFFDSKRKSFWTNSGSSLYTIKDNLDARDKYHHYQDAMKMGSPVHIIKALSDFAARKTSDGDEECLIEDIVKKNSSSAYISKVDGGCIIRLVSKTECSPFFEHSRIYVPDNQELMSVFTHMLYDREYVVTDTKFLSSEDLTFDIIGSDDITGTRLWHILKSCIDSDDNKGDIIDNCRFEHAVDVFKMSMCLLFNGYENLLKLGYKNIIEFFNSRYFNGSMYTDIMSKHEMIFGEVKVREKSFADMISIPGRFLHVLDEEKDNCNALFFINKVIDREWLYSISADEFRVLIGETLKLQEFRWDLSTSLDLILAIIRQRHQLAEHNGHDYNHSEVHKYIQYIVDLYEKVDETNNEEDEYYHDPFFDKMSIAEFYYDYITMISNPVFYGLDFRWNIPYDEIESYHNYAMEVMQATEDEQEEKEFGASYQSVKERLSSYEFTNGELSVIPPASVIDIIKEGRVLHHCVRSYVKAVCSGETDILFIRRTDKVDMPFFTLEIRNGGLRQCHGFGNKNPDENISRFLSMFCKEKGLKTGSVTDILPV